jgi:NitT/TauT family transport system ATP-binding protein
MLPVGIPHPRHQLATKEHPEFLTLRRDLFAFIEHGHA